MSLAKHPVLSIILPTRNSAHYLKFTVNNILNAPDSRFELIVVENSDESNSELKQFEGDSRLKILKNEKYLSMSENWLKGFRESKGEWFCFVGSDDGIVSQNLTYFLDFLSDTHFDLVTGHDAGFSYSINNLMPTLTIPKFKNSLRITEVKWPTKRVLAFHKLNYDMPQPYNKAFARRSLIQQELKGLERIPGLAPDLFLGYLLALKSKKGCNVDLNLFIRGLSEKSNGFLFFNNSQAQESKRFVDDLRNSMGPGLRKYSLNCRVGMQIEHFIVARTLLGQPLNSILLKFLSAWCEFSCENRDHHRFPFRANFNAFKNRTLDFAAFSLRKFWLFANFGRHIPSKNRKLTLAENATIIDAADLLKY